MELIDIYDVNKSLTGRTAPRNAPLNDGDFKLTVLAAVCTPDGKYLITRRVMSKSWGGGMWELPGGGVTSGESSLSAIIREVKEETGLDVSSWDGGYVFSYKRENCELKDNYFVDIYKFTGNFSEKDVKIEKKEADAFAIAAPEDINILGKEKNFLHFDSIKDIFR